MFDFTQIKYGITTALVAILFGVILLRMFKHGCIQSVEPANE